jgi:hypothetical protein
MDREQVAMRLEVIAAKAKQLAYDVKAGKLWDGDLGRGLGEIGEQLRAVSLLELGRER